MARPARGTAAVPVAMAAVLAASLISAGCDSTSFIPPPPPASNGPAGARVAAPSGAARGESLSLAPSPRKPAGGGKRVVELILAAPPDPDRVYLDQMLRHELAKALIPVRLTQADSQRRASPEELAGAIRAAVGRGVAGLVVEPIDGAAVVDALYDAVGRGVAVLLLDRAVAARGGRSIPHIEFTGFSEVGRRLVEAVLEADRQTKRDRAGRIVLVHHRTDDPYLERSFASMLGPCKAAGKPVEVLEFDGDADQGEALLRKSLKADPGVDILLADDMTGITAGYRLNFERVQAGDPGFLFAGFTPNDYRIANFLKLIYALGDRSVRAYASRASEAIRSLMENRPVGDVVGVPVTFSRVTPRS